jgi:hypothetical protein
MSRLSAWAPPLDRASVDAAIAAATRIARIIIGLLLHG